MDADTTIATRLRLRAGAATATGNRRGHNEDAVAVAERACLVADGMGGHAAGEVAAAIVVATLLEHLAGPDAPHVHSLPIAIAAANAAVRVEARRAGTEGMGATMVGALVVSDGAGGERVAVVHVGDSRCYRLCGGVLELVTRDHSLVQQLVDAGRLDRSDAAAHPMANVVTRALGPDDTVTAEVAVIGAAPGRLLLCSDGLSDELTPRTIGRVLAAVAEPQAAADRLVDLVLAGPARDNATAVVIDVIVEAPDSAPRPTPPVASLDTTTRLDHHGATAPASRSAPPIDETSRCA